MARTKETLSDVLKLAIAECGKSHSALERETGVKRASIMRFLRGEQSLRLDMADRLAEFFGLELRPARPTRKGR
jgi:plasmid maintenance system antidote protein VapI